MGADWYSATVVVGWFLDNDTIQKLIAEAQLRNGEIEADSDGSDYEDDTEDTKNFRILRRYFLDANVSMSQAHSRMEGNYDGYMDIFYVGVILADADAEKFEKNLHDAMAMLKEKYSQYADLLGTLEVRGLIN